MLSGVSPCCGRAAIEPYDVLRRARISLKCVPLLLLFVMTVGCNHPQDSPTSSVIGPVLRVPVSVADIPSAPMDLTRSVPDDEAQLLQAAFDEGVDATKRMLAETPGVDPSKLAFAVELYDNRLGYWSATSGITKDASERWWMASVTKMVTGAVILQMIDRGDLALTDSLDRFLPTMPDASLITIDDLLRHTSGLYSFNGDPVFRANRRYYAPDELIAIAAQHGRDFPPGTSWNYSNTGYVVLACVAEAIDGQPFADIVQTRIAAPLGLTQFGILAPGADHWVLPAATTQPPSPADIASLSGAGGLAASPRDLLIFLHAHLTGQLVSTGTLTSAFEELHPMNGSPLFFGRGVMVFDVPDPLRPARWLGHSGGSLDAKALAVYDVKRGTFMVVTINVQAPTEAFANSLLKVLDEIPVMAISRQWGNIHDSNFAGAGGR